MNVTILEDQDHLLSTVKLRGQGTIAAVAGQLSGRRVPRNPKQSTGLWRLGLH